MNRFLTPLTNAIIERNGTIDKYIGDASKPMAANTCRYASISD